MDRRGLGRGLNALLAGTMADDVARNVREIDLDRIRPNPQQPRTNFDDAKLQELVDSIREHGVLQPVLVRRTAVDEYELIAGERRVRACKAAGLTTVPAIVRECADREMLLYALIENIQRDDINPVEEARAFRRMMSDFDLTQDEVARRVGKSRSAVGNTMRLLTLPDVVLAAVEEGKLSEGHARLLVPLDAGLQTAALQAFLGRPMSVRQAEAVVRDLVRGTETGQVQPRASRSGPTSTDPDMQAVEESLIAALGAKVSIRPASAVAGTIVIEYYSPEHLEGLLERLLAASREASD